MKIEDAIVAHAAWKNRLRAFVAGKSSEKLDERQIGRDDACPLGQWLRGEGRKLEGRPEFSKLMAEHARFHQAAAGVVRSAAAGRKPEAEAQLGIGGPFSHAATQVVALLRALQPYAA